MALDLSNYVPQSGTMNYTTTGTITAGAVSTSGSVGSSTLSATGDVVAGSGTAITAGGSTNGLTISTTANFGIFAGSGAPTISAAQGSLYLRSDGSSTSTRLYVNTNGGTTWTNVTTAL